MKPKLLSLASVLVAALAAGNVVPAGEPDAKDAARKLLEKHKDAVVLVEVVVKMKISVGGQSREQEQKLEANGTVITPEGLTVVSNANIDPTAMLAARGIKADVSTSDVKIVTADLTEHEAEIALTDKDLDLAFIKPKGQVKLPCVELKKAAEPALLDTMVAIMRLGRKAKREPGVALSEVLSIIKKPRVRYVPSGQIFQGCPVFNAAGEVLGLALTQTDGAAGVTVLPCDDILEAAKQVGQKKPDDKKDPDKKPDAKEPPAEKKPDDPAKGVL